MTVTFYVVMIIDDSQMTDDFCSGGDWEQDDRWQWAACKTTQVSWIEQSWPFLIIIQSCRHNIWIIIVVVVAVVWLYM